MTIKAVPCELCHDCNGKGYKPTVFIFAPGDSKEVNIWCSTCHGHGVVPAQPEKDRTKHVRWERE